MDLCCYCEEQIRNLLVNTSDWEFSNIQYKVSEKKSVI